MEEFTTLYEQYGAPVVDFLLSLGLYTQEHPGTVAGFLVLVLIIAIVLRIVLKLAPVIILIILILLLLGGGFGISFWQPSDPVSNEQIETGTAPITERALTQHEQNFLRQYAEIRSNVYNTTAGAVVRVSSIAADCPQSALPESFFSWREGVNRLHKAAQTCPHEVAFLFVQGHDIDKDKTEWIDITVEATESSVTMDMDAMLDLVGDAQKAHAIEQLLQERQDRVIEGEMSWLARLRRRLAIDNVPRIVHVHTHPAVVFGEIAAPPSYQDVVFSQRFGNVFDFVVVDPTGYWEWSVPEYQSSLVDSSWATDANYISSVETLLEVDAELSRLLTEERYTQAAGTRLMDKREQTLKEMGVSLRYQSLGRWFDI